MLGSAVPWLLAWMDRTKKSKPMCEVTLSSGVRVFLSRTPIPPVWNFRVVSLILLFYISSFLLLPSHVALSVLSFLLLPILLTSFSINFYFLTVGLDGQPQD